MVLVHDVVPGAHVRERLQRAPEPRVGAGRPLAEDLGVGQQREAEVTPDEAPAGGADHELHGRVPEGRALHDLGLDLPEHPLRPERLPLVREGDDHAPSLPHHARELRVRLGVPARRDRRALSLERMGLRARERVELGRALERRGLEGVLLPRAPDVVRPPHEVRRPLEHRLQVVGRRERVALRLGEIDAALGSREDGRLPDGMEGSLRERRERPHLLDLLAEELDAKRLPAGAREDVDQAAANRDLPALLHPLGAFVAGECQRLDEGVQTRLVADREAGPGPAGHGREAAPPRARGQKRRRAPRPRGPRARERARRRGAQAARGRSRGGRRGSEGARPPQGRGTTPRPPQRRVPPRPRAAGRREGVRATRAARRGPVAARAPRRGPSRGSRRRTHESARSERAPRPGRGGAMASGPCNWREQRPAAQSYPRRGGPSARR